MIALMMALVQKTTRKKHFSVRAKCLGLGTAVKNSVGKCFINLSCTHTLSTDFLPHKIPLMFQKWIYIVDSFPFANLEIKTFHHTEFDLRRKIILYLMALNSFNSSSVFFLLVCAFVLKCFC